MPVVRLKPGLSSIARLPGQYGSSPGLSPTPLIKQSPPHFPPLFCSKNNTCFLTIPTPSQLPSSSPHAGSVLENLGRHTYQQDRTLASTKACGLGAARGSCSIRSWPWTRGARLLCGIWLLWGSISNGSG